MVLFVMRLLFLLLWAERWLLWWYYTLWSGFSFFLHSSPPIHYESDIVRLILYTYKYSLLNMESIRYILLYLFLFSSLLISSIHSHIDENLRIENDLFPIGILFFYLFVFFVLWAVRNVHTTVCDLWLDVILYSLFSIFYLCLLIFV